MNVSTTALLESSARRLFPDLSLDQVLAELLLDTPEELDQIPGDGPAV